MKRTNHFRTDLPSSDAEKESMSEFAQDSPGSSISEDPQHGDQRGREGNTRKSISRRAPFFADLDLTYSTQDSADDSSFNSEFISEPPAIPRVSFRVVRTESRRTESPTMITDLFTGHPQSTHSANNAVSNMSTAWFLPISDDFEDAMMLGTQGRVAAPVWRLQPRLSSSHQYAFVVGSCDHARSPV